MKVVMKPIEMIARFDLGGNPRPVKLKFEDKVIIIDQIIISSEEKLAGNRMKVYECRSEVDKRLIRYELKFELQTCRWFLYKI